LLTELLLLLGSGSEHILPTGFSLPKPGETKQNTLFIESPTAATADSEPWEPLEEVARDTESPQLLEGSQATAPHPQVNGPGFAENLFQTGDDLRHALGLGLNLPANPARDQQTYTVQLHPNT
jgi:hypothetical protein